MVIFAGSKKTWFKIIEEMKLFRFALVSAVAVALTCCGSKTGGSVAEGEQTDSTAVAQSEVKKAEVPAAKPAKPTKPSDLLPKKSEVDSASYLIGIYMGSFYKYNGFAKKTSDLNNRLVRKGIRDFLKSKGSQSDPSFGEQFKINPELMNEVFNGYLAKRNDYVAAINSEKEAAFLEENATKEGVQTTKSGLQYIIHNEGGERKLALKDTLFLHYTGTLVDGTVFDEVKPEDKSRRMFLNRLVSGWKEGLQLIGDGGEMTLYVPSKLGYGVQGQAQAGIEPNTPIIFNVKVDSVKFFVPKENTDTKNKNNKNKKK